jgi:hypothetical protein
MTEQLELTSLRAKLYNLSLLFLIVSYMFYAFALLFILVLIVRLLVHHNRNLSLSPKNV